MKQEVYVVTIIMKDGNMYTEVFKDEMVMYQYINAHEAEINGYEVRLMVSD